MARVTEERFKTDLDRIYPDMIAAIEKSIAVQKKGWAYCPKCRSKVQVDQGHDIRVILDAMKWLSDRGLGKPVSAPEAPVPVRDVGVSELSDEELLALAAAG